MKPDVPLVLAAIVTQLQARVLSELQTPFAAQTVNTAIGLLNFIAQEFDGCVARMVEENAALRQLFSAAAGIVAEPALAARIAGAAAEAPSSDLRVSALQLESDRLRALLIELQEHVESVEGPAARAYEEAIWDELKESTRRRHGPR